MSTLDDNNIHCAVYRSNDPVKNFRIRVKLERLTSNALLPSLRRLQIAEDLDHILEQRNDNTKAEMAHALHEGKTSDYEEVVIGWQQKVFNRFEFETYGKDLGPHKTAVEATYFDDIQRMKIERRQPGRIFTYIESDPYCSERDLDYFMTDSPNEQPSHLALGMNTLRKRRAAQSYSKLNHGEHIPRTNIINRKPTLEDLRVNHLASFPHQTMYIMADLSDRIDAVTAQLVLLPQPPKEHVLCRICVYSDGSIILEPDFNGGQMGYMVETGNFNNDVYHYYLEHASIAIHTDDLIKERKLFREICMRQKTYLAQIVGTDFDIPPPTVLKLNVIGEIVSGKEFDYDNIYVYYCLDLEDNWYVEPSMVLSGYTQTGSATMSSKYDDIVYYSHPFEFEVWYKPSSDSADHELPRMPKMYFQVASMDSWGRHRTEGYTYIDIPKLPGFYNEDLSCWRPHGYSIFDELRRFFVGGSTELEDITYVAVPKVFESEKENKPFSRFGFRTISTGTLNVRFNIVLQSQSFAMNHRARSRAGLYESDALLSNVNRALYNYEQARNRALEVRQSAFRVLESKPSVIE